MAVDLNEFTDVLKREITPLGSSLPTGVRGSDLAQYLIDAFWEARIDGFFEGYTVSADGVVTNMDDETVSMDRKWIALITLYAGIKILSLQILNTKTSFRAKAGPVEFEQQASATMLAEMLKQLRKTKDLILVEADDAGATPTYYFDAFSTRVFSPLGYWPALELT